MKRTGRTRTDSAASTAILLLLAAATSPLSAQTPSTTQPAGRLPTPPVSAEQWFQPGTWMLSAQLGGAAFSDFRRTEARPITEQPASGGFERRVSARTSVSVGASAGYWIGSSWGVRAGASYVPSRFSVHSEEQALRRLGEPDDVDLRYASLGIWMADATLVFRFPHSFGRVIPYGLAGIGIVHYRLRDDDELPPEAREPFADGAHSSPAGVVGLGAILPLQRNNLLLSFELTNHIARTPLDDSGRGEQFSVRGVPVQLADEPSTTATDGIGMASNLRLSIGLTLPVR
jgi:hypothetical protein